MSLLYIEGFDAYDYQYRAVDQGGVANSTAARNGPNAVRFLNNGTRYIDWGIPNGTATVIFGCAVRTDKLGQGNMIRFLNDTGVIVDVTIETTGYVTVRDGAGALLGQSTGSVMYDLVWQYIEVYVTASNTVGVVKVAVDNVTVINETGLDTVSNAGTEDIRIARLSRGGEAFNIDDVYICDGAGTKNNDFLGDTAVLAFFPSGNGTNSGLVGSDADQTDNYLLVDEQSVPVESDYVESDTSGDKDTYVYQDLPFTLATIHGVQLASHAQKSDAGAISARHLALEGATEIQTADLVLQAGWNTHSTLWEDDPVNTGDWTVANFNATEFGFEVRP